MPVHDWTRLHAGLFHHFHQEWCLCIKRTLNEGLLPADYYALFERDASDLIPDVLSPPRIAPTVESDLAEYRKRQNVVAVRDSGDDRLVAIIEIVSHANKCSPKPMRSFVGKATEFLEQDIHLLILDVHPPGPNDPLGIHGAIWAELTGDTIDPPAKPLTLVSYEVAAGVRAYVSPVAVGDVLPDVPLFLMPNRQLPLPVEATYQRAFGGVPIQIRRRLEP